MLRFTGVDTSKWVLGAGWEQQVGRDGMIELCCTKVFMVFFVFILQLDVSWDLCVTIDIASFTFLWKSHHISNKKITFLSGRCRGTPHRALLPAPHHAEHAQPISRWKLTNCQLFQQIIILHGWFSKHWNSVMYAHSATRNYRTLIRSSVSRSGIIVLGLVFTYHWGFGMHEEKLKNWGHCSRGWGCEMAENCSEPGKNFPAK